MATKGERGDVPAPWGAWLAFGVAMVCSGGLPAVVWAGRCCCGEGRPWPLRGRCGALEVSHGPCNGHPTPAGTLAQAACGLGVVHVWGRVSGM